MFDPEKGRLGSREKKVDVVFTPEGMIRVQAYFSDLYHEIELEGVFSHPDLVILEMKPRIVRFPHAVCAGAADTLKRMEGERVRPGLMKKLYRFAGKEGCFHLNALFREVVEAALWGRGRRVRFLLKTMYPDISEAQSYRIALRFRPELLDSCRAYRREEETLQRFLEAPLPPEMDFQTIEELEEAYRAWKEGPVP